MCKLKPFECTYLAVNLNQVVSSHITFLMFLMCSVSKNEEKIVIGFEVLFPYALMVLQRCKKCSLPSILFGDSINIHFATLLDNCKCDYYPLSM